MPNLTPEQKYQKDFEKEVKKAFSKNKNEKYPIKNIPDLVHNFWEDRPEFRNEKLDKIEDKKRLVKLFETIINNQIL